jgi:YebC/PmpR family DNA-binding regulatory protein
MAGHSKWANIKFRKAAQDKKRGKLFTKLIREITVAARTCGGDQENNPRLRTAVSKALTSNMTRDTIDRAIKRGIGNDDNSDYEEILYEGYGPSGIAVMVFCMTDNRNRTVGEVRHCFTKFGGSLGTDGCVAYMFNKVGQIILEPNPAYNEEQILEAVLESGAEDLIVDEDDNSIEIKTPANQDSLEAVTKVLAKLDIQPVSSEITYVAKTTVGLDGDAEQKYNKFIDMLEDLDDVQEVYTNLA